MLVKTSDLTGPALDWAVNQIEECCDDPAPPRFSTDWAQGGPIIEREKLSVVIQRADAWHASCPRYVNHGYGPTPLVAAMRCFVASKLGDEVEVPDTLR